MSGFSALTKRSTKSSRKRTELIFHVASRNRMIGLLVRLRPPGNGGGGLLTEIEPKDEGIKKKASNRCAGLDA